jgi:hypothetical protein
MEEKTIPAKAKTTIGKNGLNKKLYVILAVVILVLALGGAGYLVVVKSGYLNAFKMARAIQKQLTVSADDQKILDQLKQLIELPADVTPTMALVSDEAKLKELQPAFFANAKKGDRLIIYPDMAILFDAEANKIIKVGPVQFGQSNAAAINFAVLNGSTKSDAVENISAKILKEFNNAKIAVKGSASNSEYLNTIVVDLTGKNAEGAKLIAEKLGGIVANLPEGEKSPEGADVLVIVGNNQ